MPSNALAALPDVALLLKSTGKEREMGEGGGKGEISRVEKGEE